MAHPGIRAMFHRIAKQEIAPHVAAVPDKTPQAYIDLIARRFANPEIADTTRRVAFDGSSRHSGFIVPSIRDGLARGTPVDGLALVSAIWSRYCLGRTEDGVEIAPNDPAWPALQAAAIKAQDSPVAWLEQRSVYGDLKDAPRFVVAFGDAYAQLQTAGLEATIEAYAQQT
jgi:mannitol 2-dehydrogenase